LVQGRASGRQVAAVERWAFLLLVVVAVAVVLLHPLCPRFHPPLPSPLVYLVVALPVVERSPSGGRALTGAGEVGEVGVG
jgi:hypothetical protein